MIFLKGIISQAETNNEKIDPNFQNEDAYNDWVSKKSKKNVLENEEELAAYFKNKYFDNKDVFRKNPLDDDPFELTRKLYSRHIDRKEKQNNDYVIFYENTYKAYYEHKDELKYAGNRHLIFRLFYDFRYLILMGGLGITFYGIVDGMNSSDKEKESIEMSNFVDKGKGLNVKLLPLNIT